MTRFPMNGALAVITGAGSGIGAALARAMAARGVHLALVDQDADGLDATRRSLTQNVRVSLHRMDVTDADAVATLPIAVAREHDAPVDILVNNAGVALDGSFAEVSPEDFDWLLGINLHAPIHLTRSFLPGLRERPAAQIVNVSSIFGIIGPPGQTAYSTAKFGLRGFSEALRHELETTNVGVSVVHPGGINTSIGDNSRRSVELDPEAEADRDRRLKALLVMPPDKAGEIIAKGIEQRKGRILVGNDARMMDILQRLFPTRYWSIVAKQLQR